MPWCASIVTGWWWVLPLLGLAFMAVMLFACFRGFGCMGGRRGSGGDTSGVERELDALKEDVRRLRRDPT